MACASLFDFFEAQFAAENWVAVVKTAVGAAVVAVVGDVERDEHLDGPAEILHGQLVGLMCHGFEIPGGLWAEQGEEIHGAGFFLGQALLNGRIGHLIEKTGKIKVLVLFDNLKK